MNLLEQVQYKAALVLSGCWQGILVIKRYTASWDGNLCLIRELFRRLTCFDKIVNKLTPAYLYEHLPPQSNVIYNLRNRRNFQ